MSRPRFGCAWLFSRSKPPVPPDIATGWLQATALALLVMALPAAALAQQVAESPAPPAPPGSASTSPAATSEALAPAGPMPVPADVSAPAVRLATVDPGLIYWQRFGHNALLIGDDDGAIAYNFGYFDFEQPDFMPRFLGGRMLYQAVAFPAGADLAGYAAEQRSVHLQLLDLAPAQAQRLAAALARAVQPDQRDYLYEYFRANCSTRIRDALDAAMDGGLRSQTAGRSRGYTYRMHALRLAAGLPWMALGIDLGLGPDADRRLSFWDEMFIPELLRRHLREVRSADGGPLVLEDGTWFDSGQPAAPEQPPNWRWRFGLTGLVLAAGLLWLGARSRRHHRGSGSAGAATASGSAPLRGGAPASAQSTQARHTPPAGRRVLVAMAAAWHLLCGLAGVILLLLWLATDHVAAHGNENLFLLSPLSLLLVPAWLRRWRPDRAAAGPVGTALAWAIALLALTGLLAKFLPQVFEQANLHWCLLLVPVHLALLRAWRHLDTPAA